MKELIIIDNYVRSIPVRWEDALTIAVLLLLLLLIQHIINIQEKLDYALITGLIKERPGFYYLYVKLQ